MCALQFFCFVALVAFGVDVFFQVRDRRRKYVARLQQSGSEDSQPTTGGCNVQPTSGGCTVHVSVPLFSVFS